MLGSVTQYSSTPTLHYSNLYPPCSLRGVLRSVPRIAEVTIAIAANAAINIHEH